MKVAVGRSMLREGKTQEEIDKMFVFALEDVVVNLLSNCRKENLIPHYETLDIEVENVRKFDSLTIRGYIDAEIRTPTQEECIRTAEEVNRLIMGGGSNG